MPDSVRITCTRCQRSIYTVEQDGKPLPLVVRVVVGAHPDAGTVDVTDRALPPLVRELLAQPISRGDYCVPCFTEVLGPAFEATVAPPPTPALSRREELLHQWTTGTPETRRAIRDEFLREFGAAEA